MRFGGKGRAAHLETLYRLTDSLYRANDVGAMLEAGLDAISEGLGCPKCSILLFDPDGVMRFVAWRGLSEHYRKSLEGHTPWRPGTVDPPPIFVSDIRETQESDSVKRTIEAEGIRALAFIPLTSQGKVIGKFMAYHAAPHTYSDAAKTLAVTIARQLGFSLERAQAEKARLAVLQELQESEQRFRIMAEHAPVMIWMCDMQGRCLHLNGMLRRFWNVGEADIKNFDWRSSMHPEDIDHVMGHMGAALRDHVSVTVSGRYRNAAGEYRTLETVAHPRFSVDGTFMGLTGVNTDTTDRIRAEKALRESEERFRLVVEASPSGMVMTNGDGRIMMINARCERLFGYERGELIGQFIEVLVPPAMREQHPSLRDRHVWGPGPHLVNREVTGRRKDGRDIPLEIGVNPILTSEGMRVIATVADIAERKHAEEQRELLLAELNHRVKNTLSVVQGIAYQTFRKTDGKVRKAFEGRLQALSGAHDLLTRSHWENTSLHQLVTDALQLRSAAGQRITADGPPILLSPHAALSIALALHELFTNTMKYGALSNDEGQVDLRWRCLDSERKLQIAWRETGGPPVSKPAHRGFGSLLLERTLARDLDGSVEMSFDPAGVVCVIEMPLSVPGGHACRG
ncbi:PAS domain S-box protein [Aestuariivirga sp.]|uniref:PAS domain S-box protein n=1 Tax=Aestuariivirga sp. TaxID=2650926 RepID=UPI00391BEE7A